MKNTIAGFKKDHSVVHCLRGENVEMLWVPFSAGSMPAEPNHQAGEAGEVCVLSSGKDGVLSQSLLRLLDSAQHTVVLCSFLLADTAMEDAISRAADRGVRVYLMLACEARLDTNNADVEFEQHCMERHKAMLKRLGGKVMIRSAPHFHAKIVLVDAIGERAGDAQGILLTANMTTEAFERNEEIAVCLSQDEIVGFVDILRWAFFESAEHQMLDNTSFQSVKPLERVSDVLKPSRALSTSPSCRSIFEHAMEIAQGAKTELVVASFGWEKDHAIVAAICEQAKRGVKVTVLARMRRQSMPALVQLRSAGAKVIGFRWLHAKAIWSDADYGLVTSANFQSDGLDTGFELGMRFGGARAWKLKEQLDNFLSRGRYEFLLSRAKGEVDGEAWAWRDNKLCDIQMGGRHSKHLGTVVAACASQLDAEPDIPRHDWFDVPAHEVEYQWSVEAPKLSKGAREVFWEELVEDNSEAADDKPAGSKRKTRRRSYMPKVYDLGNQRKVIAVSHQDELPLAVKLRDETFEGAKIVVQ